MMGRQEQEMLGRDVLSDASFIGAAGDSVIIRFPRKSDFLFQLPAHPDAESRSQKGVSLKDFEICGAPKKELLHNRHEAINLFGTVICAK
jgi:hypothetical protein